MRTLRLCAIAAVLAALHYAAAQDLDSKCSYCLATSEVLSKRVENERPRNHIDLRHRLDKEGSRYGKILDFRLSELRIFELLDNLSKDLSSYVPIAEDGKAVRWEAGPSDKDNATALPEEELRHRRGELKRWCDTVMEVHEDAVTELLQSESLSRGGIQDALCQKVTRACAEEANNSAKAQEL